MLIIDEIRKKGQTALFLMLNLLGFSRLIFVSSVFLRRTLICNAEIMPMRPNRIKGSSLFRNLKKKAPIIGPRTVPNIKPDSRLENTVALFSGDDILPAYPNKAGLVADPKIP